MIVGFGGSIHDFATCLLTPDDRVVAVEDERLSRVRYAYGEPDPCRASLAYCLDAAGLDAGAVRVFAANDMLDPDLRLPGVAPTWLNHHHTHATSTFFTSPFEEAAILVADGAGSVIDAGGGRPAADHHERETTTWAFGRGNDIAVLGRVIGGKAGAATSNDPDALMSNSLGDLYRAVTEAIGFGFLQAGKTMGLAPYGDDRFVDRLMEPVDLGPDGTYAIRMYGPGGILDQLAGIERGSLADDFITNACVAAAGQAVLETVLLHVLQELWDRTRCPNLCLAGGVALNCTFNGKISELTPFENVHVVYSPGDSGTAIGAAVAARLAAAGAGATWRIDAGPYLGRPYPDTLDGYGEVLTEDQLCQRVAGLLHQGQVVGWFQGGAEFGPRALGNRSLLANPTDPEVPARINKIKGREWFRPVAPVVLAEHAQRYFDARGPAHYMQFSWPVREAVRAAVPAICHVDGSARVQTLETRHNPLLAGLINEFARQGGPPVLVNTSLNVRGEPIVETPAEAMRVLAEADVDAIVVGHRMIKR
ncbi:carbamoyltransferase [Phytohabitans rumicis]|uniref:Carbamoyltransferase n=1 Tax=Phytohabitans rumicis TaxID=1076125 RepID=A0A6V8LH29_9ACTN|nr:carbamoyltransferase [Phytohabitans rumicis]